MRAHWKKKEGNKNAEAQADEISFWNHLKMTGFESWLQHSIEEEEMTNIVVKDAVIFITGASRKRGIGRALVEEAVKRGAKRVYATARNISQLVLRQV